MPSHRRNHDKEAQGRIACSNHQTQEDPATLHDHAWKRICTTVLFKPKQKSWRHSLVSSAESQDTSIPDALLCPESDTDHSQCKQSHHKAIFGDSLQTSLHADPPSSQQHVVPAHDDSPIVRDQATKRQHSRRTDGSHQAQLHQKRRVLMPIGQSRSLSNKITSIPSYESRATIEETRQSLDAFFARNDAENSDESDSESDSDGLNSSCAQRNVSVPGKAHEALDCQNLVEEGRQLPEPPTTTARLGNERRQLSHSTKRPDSQSRETPSSSPTENATTCPDEISQDDLNHESRSSAANTRSLRAQSHLPVRSSGRKSCPGSGQPGKWTSAHRESLDIDVRSKDIVSATPRSMPLYDGDLLASSRHRSVVIPGHQETELDTQPALSSIIKAPASQINKDASTKPSDDSDISMPEIDEENVYKMMDDVTKHVLSATRPMPSSKLAMTPGGSSDDSKQLLTKAMCSDARPEVDLIMSCELSAVDRHFERTRDDISRPRSSSPISSDTTSALSVLSRSPSPPPQYLMTSPPAATAGATLCDLDFQAPAAFKAPQVPTSQHMTIEQNRSKRKMTGVKSKHFSPIRIKRSRAKLRSMDSVCQCPPERDNVAAEHASGFDHDVPCAEHGAADEKVNTVTRPEDEDSPVQGSTRLRSRKTGKVSEHFSPKKPVDLSLLDRVDLYNTTSSGRGLAAGISICPVPSILEDKFGIVQEKLWREPFWLIIAVVFLNQTTGRAAIPTFWDLKAKFPTVESLASAEQEEVKAMIQHLGLQNSRSKRVIDIAKIWLSDPPVAGRRHRTLHYPSKGDGKEHKRGEILDSDSAHSPGSLEIGHIPGCGGYAFDSWRIFCRDVLRGVADDYNGGNAHAGSEGSFEPEWKRVLPQDKELRACIRWMWLREGYIWDPLTGARRLSTQDEMRRAVEGKIEIWDPQERKFAAQAAGVVLNEPLTHMSTAENVSMIALSNEAGTAVEPQSTQAQL